MIRLSEAQAKDWLRGLGLPVPRGAGAATSAAAAAQAAALGGRAMVKAMIPTGRRGKAGAVLAADDTGQCAEHAAALLGTRVNGHRVDEVYVEERVDITTEHYLAFVLGEEGTEVLLSRTGGVDIEDLAGSDPGTLVRHSIDPLQGLPAWTATELWRRSGVRGELLPRLGELTSRLHSAFRAADAVLLELNPLAVTGDGSACLVGAMAAIDDAALYRQPQWRAEAPLPENPRERAVAAVNLAVEGGECQYTELDGDIGLLVGGGGAGLYLHDQVLAHGGKPANHCVSPPMGADTRKLKAVLEAILGNPSVRGVLVGFNFAQMARADVRVRTLVEVLDERGIDTRRLPIVIRLVGGGEAEARALIEGRPGVHYLPRGATLAQAAQLVVRLTAQAGSAA
ncbi:MAG TPA: ATP-grasp domain-containing protein [Ramlibacter sp.]|nr:ATP-grasp domain-containing protein [Ramlibacter sp.]